MTKHIRVQENSVTYNGEEGVELCELGAVMYTSNIRFKDTLSIQVAFGIPDYLQLVSPGTDDSLYLP